MKMARVPFCKVETARDGLGIGWPAEEFNVCLQPVYSSSQWPMLQSRAPNLAIHVLTPAIDDTNILVKGSREEIHRALTKALEICDK